MASNVITLPQKVFVVKNYYQITDMFEVRLLFNRRYSMNLDEKVLEVFFKIVTQFELTGSINQVIYFDGKPPQDSSKVRQKSPEPVTSPKRRGRSAKTTPPRPIIKLLSDSEDDNAGEFIDDTENEPEPDHSTTENKTEVPTPWNDDVKDEVAEEQSPAQIPPETVYNTVDVAYDVIAEEEPKQEVSEDTEDPDYLAPKRAKRAKKKAPVVAQKPRFQCCICEKTYTKDFIRAHMRKHDLEGCKYHCKVCKAPFDKYETLVDHEEAHIPTSQYKFKCESCGEKFVSEDKRTVHMKQKHTNPKACICEHCGVTFAKPDSLRVHRRTHTGEKPLKCRECDESFAFYGALKSHMRKHTEGLYKCSYCDKSFAYKTERTNHQREHTEKPYVCHICSRACVTSANLRSHIKILHQVEMTLEEIQQRNFVGSAASTAES